MTFERFSGPIAFLTQLAIFPEGLSTKGRRLTLWIVLEKSSRAFASAIIRRGRQVPTAMVNRWNGFVPPRLRTILTIGPRRNRENPLLLAVLPASRMKTIR